jgi:hypothetical protein
MLNFFCELFIFPGSLKFFSKQHETLPYPLFILRADSAATPSHFPIFSFHFSIIAKNALDVIRWRIVQMCEILLSALQ